MSDSTYDMLGENTFFHVVADVLVRAAVAGRQQRPAAGQLGRAAHRLAPHLPAQAEARRAVAARRHRGPFRHQSAVHQAVWGRPAR